MSEEKKGDQEENWLDRYGYDDEWQVMDSLRAIRDYPPKLIGKEWENYDPWMYHVLIVCKALKERPDLIAKGCNPTARDRAVYLGRRIAATLHEELGRHPTKGDVIRRLEKDWPEEREAISKSDPIPKSTATRYFEDCRLSHLEQDRGG